MYGMDVFDRMEVHYIFSLKLKMGMAGAPTNNVKITTFLFGVIELIIFFVNPQGNGMVPMSIAYSKS